MKNQSQKRRLIEFALPLEAIKKEARARKQKAPKGYPASFHKWWSPKPVSATQAIFLASIIEDPSESPELFPTKEQQSEERNRLLRLIGASICWDKRTASAEREELKRIIKSAVGAESIALVDPFCGSGAIPYAGQEWEVKTIATDLNPVSVVINRCLLQLPFLANGFPGIKGAAGLNLKHEGCHGLSSDIKHYGERLKEILQSKIGHFFSFHPEIKTSEPHASSFSAEKVSAWIWARTVSSPNPAFKGSKVPLVSSFVLCTRPGSEAYIQPVIENGNVSYTVIYGAPPKQLKSGTKEARGANFRCILSGDPITPKYIKSEGAAGRLYSEVMSLVVADGNKRVHIEATPDDKRLALKSYVHNGIEHPLGKDPRALWTPAYGLDTFEKLYTNRQLMFFVEAIKSLDSVVEIICSDFQFKYGNTWESEYASISADSYSQWIRSYLSLAIDRCALYGSSLCTWLPKDNALRDAMPRQGLAMSWGFAEGNPFGKSSAGLMNNVRVIVDCVENFHPRADARSYQLDAASSGFKQQIESAQEELGVSELVFSFDPPYYDMIGYSDLSDYFYTWLKSSLGKVWPDIFATIACPKADEIFVAPSRHDGSKRDAAEFFATRLESALSNIYECATEKFPTTIYYAFKQKENDSGGAGTKTAWEAFLEAVIKSGFVITATWLVDTEGTGRMSARDSNSIMTSTVLVCRKGLKKSGSLYRRDFILATKESLAAFIPSLVEIGVSPVDIRQAAIGRGMSIFSSSTQVVNADDSTMTVGAALRAIADTYDQIIGSDSTEWDPITRVCASWFEEYGWSRAPYYELEKRLQPVNLSSDLLVKSGVAFAQSGEFWLRRANSLPSDWTPLNDAFLTAWEITHHLVRALETLGEEAAAIILNQLSSVKNGMDLKESAKSLTLHLYQSCEKLGLTSDSRSYNGLVIAWPELDRQAAAKSKSSLAPIQTTLI